MDWFILMTWSVSKEEPMKTYGSCTISRVYDISHSEKGWNGRDTSDEQRDHSLKKSRYTNQRGKDQDADLGRDDTIQTYS